MSATDPTPVGRSVVVADEHLRAAIELAFVVAVHGARQRPPVPAPPPIRPYLRFQKLPSAALAPVRKAVETDAEFRERAASVATEDLVGRPGWLWLHRPEGWEAELEQLAAAEEAEGAAADEARAERQASRRLEAAEAAVRRHAAEVAALHADLEGERNRRRAVEVELNRLGRRADQIDVELGGARRRMAAAEAARAEAEGRAAKAEAAARAAIAGANAAQADLVAERARADAAEARLAAVEAQAEGAVRAAPAPAAPASMPDRGPECAPSTLPAHGRRVLGHDAPLPPRPSAPTPTDPGPADPAGVAAALAAAAEATHQLAAALARAGAALGGPLGDDTGTSRRAGDGAAGNANGDADGVRPSRSRKPPRPRRSPVPLPGGVLAESAEAATHLVRVPGILVVVDGYNVAKLGWPDQPLPVQRERLLDALDELVVRHGPQVQVVFDGADVLPLPAGRRMVRVAFSPAGVTADDVIVDLVAQLPPEQAVVVASNDGEVRAGARAGGANVLSSGQLLAVARR